MPQLPAPRPRMLGLFYVLFVIVFGLFHYFVNHYQYTPGGGSYMDWNARDLAVSMAGVAIGLWVIVWLNRRYAK